MKEVKLQFLYWIIAVQSALVVTLLVNHSQPVHAQSTAAQLNLYIEPGTQMLMDPSGKQNVMGKVAIDLTTGNVWGFPTYSGASYPTPTSMGGLGSPNIPVSKPFLLARFDLGSMAR